MLMQGGIIERLSGLQIDVSYFSFTQSCTG